MKKIVLATDGSIATKAASAMAAKLLDAWPNAILDVLYVTSHDAYAYDLVPDAVDKLETQITEQIASETTEFFRQWAPRVTFIHRVGHPAVTITEVAMELSADLIVIGSHGHGVVDRLLLGSVAHSVLNRAKIPVLVVRD